MWDRAAVIFLLLVVYFWTVVKGAERLVQCRLSESCILPCPFDPGPEVVIHWLQPPGDSVHSVHSFYHEKDQLDRQKPQYKGRTRLFNNQIDRGNASLLIIGIQVKDGARYKCYTSTTRGNNEDFITVSVEDHQSDPLQNSPRP
ncbi:hypothetical protein NL108_015234 [Boleophthalmus pectinirostris]|nr:hypothetical protein NL108_015234 [Boleophthalmus pectinirostris]